MTQREGIGVRALRSFGCGPPRQSDLRVRNKLTKKPKAKGELSEVSAAAYERIRKHNVLSPDGEMVLVGALAHYDTYLAAKRAVARHGLLVKDDRGNLRRNPAVAIQLEAYRNFLAGVRLLGVEAVADELAEA